MVKRTISPAELEEVYSIPVGTAANLRCAKKGPRFFKLGKKVLYRVEDVEQWLAEHVVLTIDQGREDAS